MRAKSVIILIFLFIAGTCYGKSLKIKRQIEKPYKSFIVVEEKTGKILMAENEEEKRIPASLTKLMLSLLVLEKIKSKEISLSDRIMVSKRAAKIGGSQLFLKEGEVYTLEELMKATLCASANDAAYLVAEKIAGSAEDFVKLMNEKAKTLGMRDTTFRSVNGLPRSNPNDTDLTTCKDMATLARELLKHPKILEWTSIKTEPIRAGRFIMVNHNKLLTRMEGVVDGLKTGYLRASGYNIVATAKKENFRVIVVVLGAPSAKSRDDFTARLIEKVYSEWKIKEVVKRGEEVSKDIILLDGKYKRLRGVANESVICPVRKMRPQVVEKELHMPSVIEGEIKEGQKLGEMVVKVDGELVGKVDVVSPVYVPKANLLTRIIRKAGLNI